MSIIERAIDAEKERAATQSPFSRGTQSRVRSKSYTAPVRLEGGHQIALDPRAMERACLLPFISDKGAISAYSQLRTRVLQRMRDNRWRSLIVTGPSASEGKTTTALNLAIGISEDVGQTVLLVDLDSGRPTVAGRLGLRRSKGLSDYLAGNADANEVIYNTDIDRLLVLPNFEPMHSSDLLGSPRLMALLESINSLAPNLIVIFDLPPILHSDSVLAFGPNADALLLVISEGQTNRSLLKRALEMIEDIPRVGTVLTRASEGQTSGYY